MANSNQPEYVVEHILKKRTFRGVEQFLIKWKGCDSAENTWEPKENLNCEALLNTFLEEEANAPKKRRGRKPASLVSSTTGKDEDTGEKKLEEVENKRDQKPKRKTKTDDTGITQTDDNKLNGFEQGLVAESLVGITEDRGEIFFLIKWQNKNELELVPSKETRKYIPEMVIDFYERRIIWNGKVGKD